MQFIKTAIKSAVSFVARMINTVDAFLTRKVRKVSRPVENKLESIQKTLWDKVSAGLRDRRSGFMGVCNILVVLAAAVAFLFVQTFTSALSVINNLSLGQSAAGVAAGYLISLLMVTSQRVFLAALVGQFGLIGIAVAVVFVLYAMTPTPGFHPRPKLNRRWETVATAA